MEQHQVAALHFEVQYSPSTSTAPVTPTSTALPELRSTVPVLKVHWYFRATLCTGPQAAAVLAKASYSPSTPMAPVTRTCTVSALLNSIILHRVTPTATELVRPAVW